MATIQTEDYGPVTFPDTPPIHLEGEADAYPGELFEDAYKRLFYVACQCGYMVSKGEVALRPYLTVWTTHHEFYLAFSYSTRELVTVSRKIGGEWRKVWEVSR